MIDDTEDRFATAVVGQPFGIEGFAKLKSLSGECSHLLGLSRVVLRNGTGEKEYCIEAMKQGGSVPGSAPLLFVKFSGIDSPEDVKKLVGCELLVTRAAAAPLEDGEFYISDLKGLKVYCPTSEATGESAASGEYPHYIGEITDIIEGGGGLLAEIRLFADGSEGRVCLVPFRAEFFGDVSVQQGSALLLKSWILE
jgi:16S rRNA processing protein RimM